MTPPTMLMDPKEVLEKALKLEEGEEFPFDFPCFYGEAWNNQGQIRLRLWNSSIDLITSPTMFEDCYKAIEKAWWGD